MDRATSGDAAVRMAAFKFLETELEKTDELTLPFDLLRRGFDFDGRRVPLLGPQGIFKPAILRYSPYHHDCPAEPEEGRPLPRGEPAVSNGLTLCKLHHAAYDRNILGIRPDLGIEIRSDILAEIDGPMLQHGLQGLHRTALMVVPRRMEDRPDPGCLEERYEEFRRAG